MAAMGGMMLCILLLVCALACAVPAAAGLIGCRLRKSHTGKPVKRIVRIVLWAVLTAGIVIAAVPAMYLFLILSNW